MFLVLLTISQEFSLLLNERVPLGGRPRDKEELLTQVILKINKQNNIDTFTSVLSFDASTEKYIYCLFTVK